METKAPYSQVTEYALYITKVVLTNICCVWSLQAPVVLQCRSSEQAQQLWQALQPQQKQQQQPAGEAAVKGTPCSKEAGNVVSSCCCNACILFAKLAAAAVPCWLGVVMHQAIPSTCLLLRSKCRCLGARLSLQGPGCGAAAGNIFDAKTEKGSAELYFHYYGMLMHQQNMLQVGLDTMQGAHAGEPAAATVAAAAANQHSTESIGASQQSTMLSCLGFTSMFAVLQFVALTPVCTSNDGHLHYCAVQFCFKAAACFRYAHVVMHILAGHDSHQQPTIQACSRHALLYPYICLQHAAAQLCLQDMTRTGTYHASMQPPVASLHTSAFNMLLRHLLAGHDTHGHLPCGHH
jgi:hypothetical protein